MFAYYFCPARDREGINYCDADFVKIDTIDNLFIDKLKAIRIDEEFVHPQHNQHSVTDINALKKDIRSTESALEKQKNEKKYTKISVTYLTISTTWHIKKKTSLFVAL